jgi:D-alanyl-D-alanine carboxypeptidase
MSDVARSCRLVVIAIAVALAVGGCTSTSDRGRPTLQERVQKAADAFLETRDIPGASVAVIMDGREAVAVSGFADLERRQPIQPDDEFRLASITKNYVAALALDLDREGVLRLDVPVGRWLSEVPSRLAFLRDVTMRQLLSHTSGLAQTFTDDRDRGRNLTIAEVLERIPPPACVPGGCWSYADGNYVIAGIVVAAATGRSLSQEMRARFLDPLDLSRTHFLGEGDEPVPSYVLVVDPVRFEPVEPHRLRRQLLPIVTDSRAAQMMTSASDLAHWEDALFAGRAIGRAAVARMTDTRAMRDLPCPHRCPDPYGLGVFRWKFGGREFFGHDGSSGTIVATDPQRKLTIAIVTNGGEADMGRFFEAILAATRGA